MNVLTDLNRAGKPTSGARKIGKEEFEDKKTEKIALFGIILLQE